MQLIIIRIVINAFSRRAKLGMCKNVTLSSQRNEVTKSGVKLTSGRHPALAALIVFASCSLFKFHVLPTTKRSNMRRVRGSNVTTSYIRTNIVWFCKISEFHWHFGNNTRNGCVITLKLSSVL